MKKTRIGEALIGLATLLLVVGAYVGVYVATSDPIAHIYRAPGGYAEYRGYRERIGGGDGGGYLETFFWPMSQLDRELRPERWGEP